MKPKTHFAFRVDIWDDTGGSIVEHVVGVDDFEVAEATYRAAVARRRQGARIVHELQRDAAVRCFPLLQSRSSREQNL